MIVFYGPKLYMLAHAFAGRRQIYTVYAKLILFLANIRGKIWGKKSKSLKVFYKPRGQNLVINARGQNLVINAIFTPSCKILLSI